MVTANKERTKPKKVNKLRNAEYYGMQDTFDELFTQSTEGKTFDRLMDMILSRDNILLAYRNMKGNTGSVTPGTDGLTIQALQKCDVDELVRKVRNIVNNYTPRPVRRKEIPKPGNPSKTRPLGIPCIWDRLIQQCILQILEPICEARFSNNSYGFRPNRSCEHAIAASYMHMQVNHLQYAIEIDIKSFFDEVDHSKLIKQIWAMGIQDKKLIYILKRILKAPIKLENDTIIMPTKSTPQGGLISPLLANIVLNELDKWVESQWQENPVTGKYCTSRNANGSRNKGNGYQAMKKTRLKEMYIVRYADDLRIFCRKRSDADRTLIAVKHWLKERLRLEISDKKTRVVNLRKQYSEFLGIKMKLRPKASKLVVKSHICDKAIARIRTEARQKMIDIARPPQTEAQAALTYNAYVMGVHNYYRMATNVNLDFARINYQMIKIAKRLGKRLKREPKIKAENAITKRYGKSDMMRFVGNIPIVPIGFIQTKNPMRKKRSIQKYTPEGRKEIHKNLGFSTLMLQALVGQEHYKRSTEFSDNRLSLYCAQYGKCAVTGHVFDILEDIHCHHKTPKSLGGSDKYQNLVLVRESVHKLIHATAQEAIDRYLAKLDLCKSEIRKLNKLRKEAGKQPVAA